MQTYKIRNSFDIMFHEACYKRRISQNDALYTLIVSYHVQCAKFSFFCCWHFSFFSSKTIGYFTILPMTNNWQLCPFREISNDTANFFWIDIAHIICFALQSLSLAFYYLHDIDNTGRLQQIQSEQSIEFLLLCRHLFISFFLFLFITHI